MYRALVVSVLLYGSEAWTTTLADRRRLDVFDMRCQRRLLRVFWQQHVSNQSIRERTKQPTTASLLRQHRLRWLGHFHRMPSSLPVRRFFDFNPNIHGWKRPRGRPKTKWADSIKHDLHSAGLNTINAVQMVYDRPPVEGLCLRTTNARTRAWPLSQGKASTVLSIVTIDPQNFNLSSRPIALPTIVMNWSAFLSAPITIMCGH